MKFYTISPALQEAIDYATEPVRLRIEIDIDDKGRFESVFEHDILEADFFGLKEVAGGISSRGELLLSNNNNYVTIQNAVGREVRVSFSIGEGVPYFRRFVFYIDDKGIQDIRGPGRRRYVRLSLRDLSYRLRKTDEARDWTAPAVFTYSVVSNKTQPEKSLLHGIAARAGLGPGDIECSTIPVSLPYVRLRRNTWAELSSMATAFRCHLECAPEKPLVFAHSPFQLEPFIDDDIAYTFTGEDIFYFRKTDRADLYRNTVRLKINLPVSLDKQEIWRYEDPPVFYDDDLRAYYPFKDTLIREMEAGQYEVHYRVVEDCGKVRTVVYADQIDTKEEAESRLEYEGGPFSFSHYDVTTNHDRASLSLHKESEGDLYKASIYGRPIVIDLNRSCFMRDVEAVEKYGTVALNVTGSYFSEDVVYEKAGIPFMQYEDWVTRELAKRLQDRREFTIKTHRGLFNARIGARVQITAKNETSEGVINAFSFRYRKDRAFIAAFRIIEG